MKRFLASPTARRIAWMTLVALATGFGAPLTGRAEAQTSARTAYLVPFSVAEGMDAELGKWTTSELGGTLRKFRNDPQVKAPIELVSLNKRNPVITQAIQDGGITEEQVDNPPADKDGGIAFARALGLTTVLVGSIDSYKETEAKDAATIEVTVYEYYVPQQADLAESVTRTVSKTATVKAKDDREKRLLASNAAQRIALMVASTLLDAPQIAPTDEVAAPVAVAKKGGVNPLWVALGVAASVALIFLFSSIGSSKDDAAGGLTPTNVVAQAEADSVRITWTAVAGAIGYNVYRRAVGSQTLRSRGRSRQSAAAFELLVNPDTNTTPTVVGGSRVSFIDTTAINGVIYEYAVAGVSASNEVSPLSTTSTAARAGANIGTAPVLSASSGNGFIALSWTPSSGFVDGYLIFRRQGGTPDTGKNSPDELARVSAITSYDDTAITNGVSYTYIVQPMTTVNVNGLLAGADSNPVTVAGAIGAAPQAPRNVAATVDTAGRVVLTWSSNPEANIDFYEVMQRRDRSTRQASSTGRAPWLRDLGPLSRSEQVLRTDPRSGRQLDLSSFTLIGTADSHVTTFTHGPLPDGTYTYAVRAVNSLGQRGAATAAGAVTVNAALAAPAGVAAVGSANRVRVSWQPVAGDVAAYRVYRSATPIDASMVGPTTAPGISLAGEVAGTVLAFDDLNLANNVIYYYAVTSVDSGGAESDFGKGTATAATGAIGVPHAAPTAMAFDLDRSTLSGNGQSTATATVTVRDANGGPTAGVSVDLTTEQGTFINLPTNAATLDTAGRQVRALTDANGQVIIGLQSERVLLANSQVSVNLQARAPELPDAVELVSRTVSFVASLPAAILLTTSSSTLTADGASTCDLTARVVDDLGQPVPNGAFSVNFELNSTNGQIRAAGNVQSNPFISVDPATGRAIVWARVVDGVAGAVYKAGTDASSTQAAIILKATAADYQTPPQDFLTTTGGIVQSQTVVSLEPGAPARIDFGLTQMTIPRSTTANAFNIIVRDFKGNPVRSGTVVNFTVQPTGFLTVPATGTTNDQGEIPFTVTAGATAGGAVIIASIAGTQVQSQLVVNIQ